MTGWNRRSLRSTAHRWCDAWFSLRTARESRLFLRYALTVADIHSRSSRQLHVEVRILADISLHCRAELERGVVDAAGYLSDDRRLYCHHGTTETVASTLSVVVPPEYPTLEYRSLRISTTSFMVDWNVV